MIDPTSDQLISETLASETLVSPNREPQRAWYKASIADFLQTPPDRILGHLAIHSDFNILSTQKGAWLAQVEILKPALDGLDGTIFLEMTIPRMGRRVDAVVVIGPIVFVVEFKVGAMEFDRSSREQVWDYALDLKNFHEASHGVPLVPILVATSATTEDLVLSSAEDGVYTPMLVGAHGLRPALELALKRISGAAVDSARWLDSSYRPTPTIIEAARVLYAQHSVEAIARYDAGAENLRVTSLRIESIVDEARAKKQKAICFVTGVPGAGKTLVGLNIATRNRREMDQSTHAVFLSGNGPLVKVLSEALTRDEVCRRKLAGEKVRKSEVADRMKAFIQNVHHFRDEGLLSDAAPVEHVVIFDEAQRAWNQHQTAHFMSRKKGLRDFNQSEPEFLISYMDRHADWAVIICLVGGGQEINTGEAGIEAWLDAVRERFSHWQLFISQRLTDREYAAGHALRWAGANPHVCFEPSLHLAVNMRSFRSERVSEWVKAVLDDDFAGARASFAEVKDNYPIVLTRDLSRAKDWVRSRARGSERVGLLASSKAQRLKPHAIDIRVDVDPVVWFLNGQTDPRASYYLEDAATEFQVQGLELDWTCVAWDADLRFSDGTWKFHDFIGHRWCHLHKMETQNYLRNAYRVLLTRARQGMVIFVPQGDSLDHTRVPEFYDGVFRYLSELGVPIL